MYSMAPKHSKQNVKSFYEPRTPYVDQSRQHMAQNHLLVWTDANINQTNKHFQNVLAHLNNVASNINLCTQSDQCIQLLNQVRHERVFVITSGSLGQHLVPEIHNLSQVDAIYIFCSNKVRHQEWARNWTKIKGVYTNFIEICQLLQLVVKQCDQQSIPVSFVTANEMTSTDYINQLEPNFMYTQIFKEILLAVNYDPKEIKNLAAYCRELYVENEGQLQVINEFECDYRPQRAIWWYTRAYFIYQMLNQALRTLDADTITKVRFFLRDLHQQIEQLHEQQISIYGKEPFVVYRGHGLTKSDFEKLQKTKGGLMSFDNFLSSSKNEQVSLSFAQDASTKSNMVGILFTISVDPSIKSVPFTFIKEVSYFKQEDEILFTIHTVFRVDAIKQMDNKNQLYQVELQLISDDDQQLQLLTNRIHEETDGTGWQRLGKLLIKTGQFDKAKEFYNVLLEQTSDEGEKAFYYSQLGNLHYNQGNYEKAIWYFEQGLGICEIIVPSNHPLLATLYNNIGSAYNKMEEYAKALSCHEKALELRQKILPLNHPDLVGSYDSLGLVYDNMEEYSKALSFYEKALEMREKNLPSNHPDLTTSYKNISGIYYNLKDFSNAILYYERGVNIELHSLLPTDPSIRDVKENLS
ncbi:unnamed protein product [Adineta steineri]|uniref:NAD(P)(+)--arginine ADP-ribosyltransferase n=1 Tax=Adineta steineri TaxID=433720 RepID=A0A814LYD2_9BILA|nr:unnamed protein product [Adineta steineri]CAF1071307.1 unnamed protein product [Adineta steineri]